MATFKAQVSAMIPERQHAVLGEIAEADRGEWGDACRSDAVRAALFVGIPTLLAMDPKDRIKIYGQLYAGTALAGE